ALRLREPYMRMPEQALGFVFTMRRFRGLERNRIYVRLRVLSKDLSEGFIRLLHKALSRAKVRAQPDRLQLHSTDAVAARSRKQFHSDMSKPINGLLWIADEKYGLTVPVPSLDQPAEQLELREGGVLHFIHQQMLNLHSKGQRQRIRFIVERVTCRDGDLDKIRATGLRKCHFQFSHGTPQQQKNRSQDNALLFCITGWRQPGHFTQRTNQLVLPDQSSQQRLEHLRLRLLRW